MKGTTAKVGLRILFGGVGPAEAVYASLVPDNVNLPEGLSLSMWIEGERVIIEFKSEVGMKTLASTVKDVLASCQVAVESLQVAYTNNKVTK